MDKYFFSNKLLAFAVIFVSALALTEMPPWIAVFVSICFLIRLFIEKRQLKPWSTNWIVAIGLALFFVVYLQYRSVFGQLESSILILGLTALSVLNYSKERDRKLITLLSFILVIMKSMFAPEIYWLLLSTVGFILLWLSMLPGNLMAHRKMFLQLLVKALPLTVLLFLIFPRIVLYQNQKYQQRFGQTGFSDQLRPGQIAQIVQDDTLAFYVQFDSDQNKRAIVLPQDSLYWRGGVLSNSQGLVWKISPTVITKKGAAAESFGEVLNYQMYFEPHLRSYVFTLDQPTELISSDKQIQKTTENTFRIRDWVQSQTVVRFQTDPQRTFQTSNSDDPSLKSISVDWAESPLTLNWLQQTKQNAITHEQKLSALEALFKNSNLKYSFQPGIYSQYGFDELLFQRKLGFCEHFAAAYATLARELGLAARVVVGYQGGRYNSIGQFWKISQKEAHAWVEILNGTSWQRIDPTAWIAPLRLQLSADEYSQLSESELALSYNEYIKIKNQSSLNDWWFRTTILVEHLNYLWSTFVIDFDLNRQLDFLSQIFSLGQKSPHMIFSAILGVILLFVLIWALRGYFQKSHIQNKPLWLLRQQAVKHSISLSIEMTGIEIVEAFGRRYPLLNIEKIKAAYDGVVYQSASNRSVVFEKVLFSELKKLTSQPSLPRT